MTRAIGFAVIVVMVVGISATVWQRQRSREREARESEVAFRQEIQTLQAELTRREAEANERPLVQSPAPSRPEPATAPAMPAVSNPPPAGAWFNDPETRALMQREQEKEIGRFADRVVNKKFIAAWNLSPEEAARAKELVHEKASAGKDLLNAMMFDGLDDDALAQRGREAKQRMERADDAVRSLLGDGGVEALRERERALESEAQVRRLREEFATADNPLTSEQAASLREAIATERQAQSFRVDFNDPAKVDFEHLRAYFAEENLQLYFEDLEQVDARVAERAALFLSARQLEQLREAQKAQMERSRLTVKVTTEMLRKQRAH